MGVMWEGFSSCAYVEGNVGGLYQQLCVCGMIWKDFAKSCVYVG